ncbi:lasso peptide biosynthesis B2 protein [Brevundimonas aurantiaca]|uniref:lasso peptide biosynthesis B2 protein n=1 Tax=Brevundimonas aurantiaca TaxID=74316 RepID=UPI00174D5A1A|nr:lasso peptide biosynthesis B2 protein [Brevundimonas aurantiaca]
MTAQHRNSPPGGQASAYALTPKTFVCIADGVAVFLDLPADDYLCLDPAQTAGLRRLLGLQGGDPAPADVEEDTALAAILMDADLLTIDPHGGKQAAILSGSAWMRELPRFPVGAGPVVKPRHTAGMLKAYLTARTLLRLRSLEHVVRRVAARKAATLSVEHPERERELVEIFLRLRPLLITRKDQCLLNALFLIEFLAGFGVYPDWWFGIRVHPFGAHCWVAKDALLYDEDVETVCEYTPIMRV